MNVCFFGIYDPHYSRNYVLRSGFLKHGYTVMECRVDPIKHTGLVKYWLLYREYQKIKKEHFKYIIVCFPGHTTVFLARLLFGKRIILDIFVSLYDSNVCDRGRYAPHTISAWRDWFLDWSSCRLAGTVLLDTQEHIHFFSKMFGLPKDKCIRVFVGANDKVFYPKPVVEHAVFTVHFHGSFIPLHGLPYIIEAARMLREENVIFHIIGSGQELDTIQNKIYTLGLQKKVLLLGRMSLQELAEHMATADMCLGIFGDTTKTLRVIPVKVYEAMAMGKAIITADTSAIRELLDEKTAVLVPPANPSALAKAILDLKADEIRRNHIALQARELFQSSLLPEYIVGDLLTSLSHIHD